MAEQSINAIPDADVNGDVDLIGPFTPSTSVSVIGSNRMDSVCWTSDVHPKDDSCKRSNEEDVYEDLCYVTLRSNQCRTRSSSISQQCSTISMEPMTKRDYCIKELLETEKNYCEALLMIIEHFAKPLCKVLSQEHHSIIFNNLDSLADLHGKLYQELARVCGQSSPPPDCDLANRWPESRTISMPTLSIIDQTVISNNLRSEQKSMGKHHGAEVGGRKLSHCFLNAWHGFLIYYSAYSVNLPKAQKLLIDLCSEDENIDFWVNSCQNKANDGRFQLRDLLSLPMQRILKYHLLLGQLICNTSKNHEDYAELEHTYDCMLDIGAAINEVKRDAETLEIIKEVQRSIVDLSMPENSHLHDYGRLIKDGEVKIRSHDHTVMRLKNRYIFLFDKVLLICKTIRGLQYNYKEAIVLEEYKLEEMCNFSPISKLTKNWSCGWCLVHNRSRQPYTFIVKNEDIKRQWLESIERAQDNVRPKQRFDHQFAMCTVPVATCCVGCSKLLKGIWYQGYRCLTCNIVVHKGCISSVKSCSPGKQCCVQRKEDASTGVNDEPHQQCRLGDDCCNRADLTLKPAPPTKRVIAKANTGQNVEKGQLMFEENDTIIVSSYQGSVWYGRNIRTGQQGSFSNRLVTELMADSPSSSSMDSPTVINCASTLRFCYDEPSINAHSNVSQTLPKKKSMLIGSKSTPLTQSILMPESPPLAASTPAMLNDNKNEAMFFATTDQSEFRQTDPSRINHDHDGDHLALLMGKGYNLEEYAWFAGSMDRQTAHNTLEPLTDGSFLVRISPKQMNSHVISIKYKGEVKHMRVQVTYSDGITATEMPDSYDYSNAVGNAQWQKSSSSSSTMHFYLSERRFFFKTIVDLVRFYSLNELSESFNMLNIALLLPYKKAYCNQVLGYAIALYAFTGTSLAASSFITLRKGDRITVLSRAAQDKGWWKGQIGDRIGYFPYKYVTPTTNSLKIGWQESSSNDVATMRLQQSQRSVSTSSMHRLSGEANAVDGGSLLIEKPDVTSTWPVNELAEPEAVKKISPCSLSNSSSNSTSSATTLSSPVNSDTLSIHSRQASSDAGIDIAGFIGDNLNLM